MVTEEEIIQAYRQDESLRSVSSRFHLSYSTIRRILITAGEYTSPRTDEINRMLEAGKTVEEIAEDFGCSTHTIYGFLPYQKGCYAVGEKTINAQRIQECRQRKQSATTIIPIK